MCVKKIAYPVLIVCVLVAALSWKTTLPSKEKQDFIESTQAAEPKEELSGLKLVDEQIQLAFQESQLENSGLDFEVFRRAYIGFINLQGFGKISSSASILSIADFSLSSKKKRLWIIDLVKNKVLLNTWVSHGRGSGGEMATQFSNTTNSYQSSLGFYVTGEVYYGKHGRSLRLDGMDNGFNNKARERAIVIHGARYVSTQAIKSLNRLGLSHGCPAVPVELTNEIIDIVKNKSVLYIHADSPEYASKFLNEGRAGESLLASFLQNSKNANYSNL